MRALIIACLAALLAGGCLLASSDDPGDEGRIGEALQAEAASVGTEVQVDEGGSKRRPDDLPSWKVYLTGSDYYGSSRWDHDRKEHHYSYPPDADYFSRMVAVRSGDEQNPRNWIELSLVQHWKQGDAYFRELMTAKHLSPLDLVAVMLAIEDAGGAPPILRTGRSSNEENPYNPFPFPLPLGDDHTGPPVMTGDDRHAPPGTVSGGRPSGRHPSGPKRAPRPDPVKWLEDWRKRQNGWRPGDRVRTPAPGDAGYVPASKEAKEIFRCEGEVYEGYKNACVDFKEMSVATKWKVKLGAFFARSADAMGDSFRHRLFHDGKNPECMATCNYLSNLGAASLVTGLMTICFAATDGACTAGLASIRAGGASLIAANGYVDYVRGLCAEKICVQR